MGQTRSRSSFAKEDLAKKHYASSQSVWQNIVRITRSKVYMAPKLKIPKTLYKCINIALETEQKLKTHPTDEVKKQLELEEKKILDLADFYKDCGFLPSDWEYNRNTATHCVPIEGSLVDIFRSKHLKAARRNSKKLDRKLKKADKVAKKRSASSPSDSQNIVRRTLSKVYMAPKIQIPEEVYFQVKLVFKTEQELVACPGDTVLLQKLKNYKEKLEFAIDFYKRTGYLPSDWKYHPKNVSNYESIDPNLVPAKYKEPKKDIRPNPHIKSTPLKDEAKLAWQKFKEFDEISKKPTYLGLPFPMEEEFFFQLDVQDEFVTHISDFAVDVFNKSCQMYRNKNNKKNISNAKVTECKYAKVQPCYLFYMDIEEVVEQEKSEVYEIKLRCNLDDGEIVLDSFCLRGPQPLGTRDGAELSLESIYETVKEDSLTDPEVYYYVSGMVHRTGGYDFYNPLGWYSRLSESY